MNRLLILVLIFTVSFSFAKTKEECLSSIDEIIQGDEVKEEKLNEFLKIQAGLTLHKLAYATFRGDISKDRFRLETEILNIMDGMEGKKKDPEFLKVYDLYKNSSNKLSRNALANVLPYIKDVLNKQENETDPFKRKMFNLGMSDIKMLSLLSEKESKSGNGIYKHILSSNQNSDNSILNFTKIINSSMRNTDDSVEDIRKTMKRRLNILTGEAHDLILDLFLNTECEILSQVCSVDKKPILDDSVLEGLTLAISKLKTDDKHKYLRYNDVWLYTKGKALSPKKGTHTKSKTRKADIIKEDLIVEKSDDDVIQEYLVQHVLDYLPYFFTRKDLKDDKELTLALSRAIDSGAATASDKNKRIFHYKGKKYQFPDTYNTSYDTHGMGRAGTFADELIGKTFNFFDMRDDQIIYPENFSENQKEAFLELRNEQKYIHGKDKSFVFKSKIYLLTGELLKPEKASILKFPLGQSFVENKISLTNPEKKEMAKEIKIGNSSYLKDGQATYISGQEVVLTRAHSKAKIRYNRSNMNLADSEDESFATKPEVIKLIKDNKKNEQHILKSLADGNRVVSSPAFTYDLVLKKEVTPSDAKQTIIKHRLGYGVIRNPSQLAFSDNYLKANASAIVNKKTNFTVGNDTFYTSTGFKIDQKKKGNSLVKGMVSHEKTHEEIVQLNEIPEKNRIAKYHSLHKIDGCEYISIIDKKNGELSVVNSNGKSVFIKDILTGSNKNDEKTRYFGNFDERKSNNSTGAGKYQLGSSKSESVSDYHNNFEGNFLTLNRKNRDGSFETITAIHQISKNSPEQNTLLNNNDSNDNRATTGGIALDKPSMSSYINKYYKEECPLFVLSETDEVEFKVVGTQLALKSTSNIDTKNYYVDRVLAEKPKKISIAINDKRFINDFTAEYVLSLQEEKTELMNSLNLTNDEYNEIAKIAFGVVGTESDFATSNLYKFKETLVGQMGVDVLKGDVYTIPLSQGIIPNTLLFGENKKNSRGPSQIKNSQSYLPKKYKDLKEFDLNTPQHAAIATMFVLANKYDSFKNIEAKNEAITDRNRMEFLYYLYMGSADQVINQSSTVGLNPKADEVRQYANSLNILQEK
jgi:hypothetical protein